MEILRRPPGDYRPSRRAVDAAGTLLADGDLVEVRLMDISRDGAKIALKYPVLAGTAVELRVNDTRIPALVHWYRDLFAGLRFLDRLDRETLSALEGCGDDDLFG